MTKLPNLSPDLLFLDIETAGYEPRWDELNERWKVLWNRKAQVIKRMDPELSDEELYEQKAAIYAEFGRVICISAGYYYQESESGPTAFKVSSWSGEERELLTSFAAMLDSNYGNVKRISLCGHNIKEFDVPYLSRRMIIHGISLPIAFQIHGKKPWEVEYLVDTLNLWKFGDYKHYTSLDLLAAVLDIPTPKSDIDGSDVHRVYYEEDDLMRIVSYCERDVVTTARVWLRILYPDFDQTSIQFPS